MKVNMAPRSRRYGNNLSPSRALLFLAGTMTGVLFVRLWDESSSPTIDRLISTATAPSRANSSSLGDGCYHIFLDVGANIGVHGRFLFEPEQYPDSQLATQTFNEQFGAERDNRDFCTFEFEPNPMHVAKLTENSKAYSAMGWKYNVLNVAAGDRDGSMTFYHNLDEEFGEWGFGVKKWTEEARSVSIPVIRLADWVETHISGRQIPSTTHGEYAGGPKVVMKMDVEGTEFVMLPDLILSGAICTIDYVFGEFHEAAAPLHFPGQEFSLEDVSETNQLRGSLLDVIRSSRNCKTQFSLGDDEGYLLDGVPLPTPRLGAVEKLAA